MRPQNNYVPDWSRMPELMTPGEVGRMFRVDPKTVTRWAKAGRVPKEHWIRTVGGHLRLRKGFVQHMYEEGL
jgi:hypothetical protein